MPAKGRDAPRRLLFVPQGGRGGTGEYARCPTLAHAARRRWPDAEITFATKARAARFDDDYYPRYVLAPLVAAGSRPCPIRLRPVRPLRR